MVTASDADVPAGLSFSIVGGSDADKLQIDAASGALSFVSAPDFEAPADADGNNAYDVVVQVSDGAFIARQAVEVTVTNARPRSSRPTAVSRWRRRWRKTSPAWSPP